MLAKIGALIALTKPRIMLLVVFSGATALILEKSLLNQPFRFLLALVALYLTGGAANALNHYFEREIDAQMIRTCSKRPLPLGRITASFALVFAIAIGLTGFLLFVIFFNWLAALLSLGTILFYSLFYTLILKPSTHHSIVIGGVAGAMAPVGMWAAASGTINVTPWLLFLIIFLWSPPHFWALAMMHKADYDKVALPMLPNIKGEVETLRQILIFSITLFLLTLLPVLSRAGILYFVIAIILGIIFIYKAILIRSTTPQDIRGFFSYSVFYLLALFVAMICDSFMNRWLL